MTKSLAMFPGQGSQYVGMGKSLVDEFHCAKEVFEEAEDALRLNLRKLCFEGPEKDLKLTANTQPSILTHSIATWTVISKETEFNPEFFAGHSLGEYSALVAARKLTLMDALKLVRTRGEQMQVAVPAGKGSMSAVLNYDVKTLLERCETVVESLKLKGLNDMQASVEIANYNSEKQLIVSGGTEAVATLGEVLAEEKVKVVPLAVSAPFHSKLMKPAREAMQPLLENTIIAQNDNKVIANITGRTEDEYSSEMLIDQIDSPVLWMQTLETAVESECNRFVEVGPGKVLFGLARRAVPKGSALITSDDVKKTIQALNGQ